MVRSRWHHLPAGRPNPSRDQRRRRLPLRRLVVLSLALSLSPAGFASDSDSAAAAAAAYIDNSGNSSSSSSPSAAAASAPSTPTTNRKRGRVPASNDTILSLRRVTAAADCSSNECAICLQDFDFDSDDIRALPCPHAFHNRCISTWLRSNAICPLCRHQLPEEEEEEEEEWWRRRRAGDMLPSIPSHQANQEGPDEEVWRILNAESIRWMNDMAAQHNIRLSFF
ncbi:hypothetical protein BS78_05G024000 [Paspalum vaginatum]|nr:hypothetical protein BS78_05G024000 [Paspalum vaginatum]